MLKFKALTLRWKILVALLSLSVIPLVITLIIVSGMVDRQMAREMKVRAEQVVNFTRKSLDVSGRELTSYATFLARNTDLVNAVYYASLTGDSEQVKRVVETVQQDLHLDVTLILDKSGTPLLQAGKEAQNLGREALVGNPLIKAALDGTARSGLERFAGRLAIVSTAPIRLQLDQIGILAAVVFVDDEFAVPLKKISGAETAFFEGDKIIGASSNELKGYKVASLAEGDIDELKIGSAWHAVYLAKLDGKDRGIILALDHSDNIAARRYFRTVIVILLAVAIGLSVAVGLSLSRSVLRPLFQVVGNLNEIAEGEGDLTRTIEVSSEDEVGMLAANFNRFVARLRDMVQRTRSVSGDLAAATDKIRTSAREVNEGAVRQSQSLEESFRAIQAIEGSVSGIAESTGSLVEAAEESSSATLELGATIEEIANQMEKLFATVDEVSSSISQMSVSSQEITENVEILSSSAEVTASSITELDASIKEIEENAEKTNRLSEEAAIDAQKGKETVDETIQGIMAIRESVDRAGTVIQELGNQSNAIGKILTVIDEVADQTSLLALNAAIIAAQAGEHGKGFAVVADEIRELAERTAVSTREIAAIINTLQGGTRDAVKAMAAGSERVHQEVERSKSAGQALEKIRTSTLKAREQVSGIVRATQEQSRGSRQITNSINQVASMLDQIASAIKQQTDGTRQLARAAEAMKEIAAQGKLSTGEQAKGSRQINLSMERIRSMIERIDEATREQSQRTRQVVEAVSSIRQISESTASRAAELDQVVDILSRQTAALEEEVGAFKA